MKPSEDQAHVKISFSVKTIVIGDQSVGKTSMICQLCSKKFQTDIPPTVGASFTCKIIDVDSHTVRFQIWDTTGSERYRSMLPMYYRKTNLAMVVYDITCINSFNNIHYWIENLEKYADKDYVICIIGNKCDLNVKRVISYRKASQLAKSIGALYFETSAKTSEGIMEAFIHISRQMVNLYHRRGSFGVNSSGSQIQLEKDETKKEGFFSCCSN